MLRAWEPDAPSTGGTTSGYRADVSEQPPAPDREPRRVPVQRSPRYSAFLLTGAVVGVVVAVVAGLAGSGDPGSRGPLIGYLAVLLGLVGGLVGGVAALLLDRRGRR